MGYLDKEGLAHFWENVKDYVGKHGGTVLPVKAPIGTIVYWSGTADNIPTGWHICDGTDGTFDLRDSFILAAGPNHPVGETGGSEEVVLTVDQMPEHNHALTSRQNSTPATNAFPMKSDSSVGSTSNSFAPIASTGGSQPHPNMPPYYTLIAIQKVSPDETDGVNYSYGIGHGLKVENGDLTVETTDGFAGDNTLPMTAAGVETVVGNIEVLLGTI